MAQETKLHIQSVISDHSGTLMEIIFLVLIHVCGKHFKGTLSGFLLSGIAFIYILCRFPYMLSTGGNLKEVASLAWNMLIMYFPALLDKESLRETF